MVDKVYIKTTNDKYEFIIAMGNTVKELADELKISENSINSAMSHARKRGTNCAYKKVVLDN